MAATTQFKGAKGRLIQTGRTTRSVFVSYCHADFRDRDAFLKFLRPMCERLGDQLDAWCFWVDSADLVGGDRWKDEIRDALAQADVFIVLMSQEYVESPFCKGIELAYILDKCHRGQARVIGVALHKLNLQDFTVTTDDGVALSLEEVQCLPQGVSREKGQEREGLVPLTLWPERRDAWSEVQTQLERALTSTKSGVRARPRTDAMPDAAKTAGALPLRPSDAGQAAGPRCARLARTAVQPAAGAVERGPLRRQPDRVGAAAGALRVCGRAPDIAGVPGRADVQ